MIVFLKISTFQNLWLSLLSPKSVRGIPDFFPPTKLISRRTTSLIKYLGTIELTQGDRGLHGNIQLPLNTPHPLRTPPSRRPVANRPHLADGNDEAKACPGRYTWRIGLRTKRLRSCTAGTGTPRRLLARTLAMGNAAYHGEAEYSTVDLFVNSLPLRLDMLSYWHNHGRMIVST